MLHLKIVRGNHKPYMTKVLRKAIMRRTALENRYYTSKTVESREAYKKTAKLYRQTYEKREKTLFC